MQCSVDPLHTSLPNRCSNNIPDTKNREAVAAHKSEFFCQICTPQGITFWVRPIKEQDHGDGHLLTFHIKLKSPLIYEDIICYITEKCAQKMQQITIRNKLHTIKTKWTYTCI